MTKYEVRVCRSVDYVYVLEIDAENEAQATTIASQSNLMKLAPDEIKITAISVKPISQVTRQTPPIGTTCENASSTPPYTERCGKSAIFVIQYSNDRSYAMCMACADRAVNPPRVRDLRAKYVLVKQVS